MPLKSSRSRARSAAAVRTQAARRAASSASETTVEGRAGMSRVTCRRSEQRQRAADEGLGRDVEHTGAETRARSSGRRRSAPCRVGRASGAPSASGSSPTRASPDRPGDRRCGGRGTVSGVIGGRVVDDRLIVGIAVGNERGAGVARNFGSGGGLMTAPSGARLPLSTASSPRGRPGSSAGG